ncbi:MAG: K+/H+ antiporter subunit F [Gammaproteobacteria bacterium]|jgi:multicomponent K+:H+ antiporter subunit F|nr:K+/H+ antiporter subunit F [Gammaproteobacteria bacterium]
MIIVSIYIAYALIGISLLLNLWRLVAGPAIVDRILALDTMFINGIALLVIYGVHIGSGLYFEIALLVALMGFVSTVALCKFFLRGDIIE